MDQSNPVFKHSSFKGLIGIAQEDITPPVGIYSRNWGASKYDVAEGIHRPLMLTCITFQFKRKALNTNFCRPRLVRVWRRILRKAIININI